MTKEERLAKAREAQAEKRRQRAEANSRALASLVRHMVGTTPLPTTPPQKSLASTDRARRFRARGREIGRIPRCRHRRVRDKYRYDLLGFGLTYGMDAYEGMKPLLKRRPSPRMERFVRALQDKILYGGLKHVRWPRGKGKTTWVKIAIIWAALYGHKRFMVVVEKTKGMAQVVVDEVWKRIHLSPRISADFPEFAVPMHDVMLSPQRMRVQTCNGKPTYMKQDVSRFHYYKLPTVEGYANTGAIIAYRGADQALRGINIDSARPDFYFIDDPQTEDDARNPATVARAERRLGDVRRPAEASGVGDRDGAPGRQLRAEGGDVGVPQDARRGPARRARLLPGTPRRDREGRGDDGRRRLQPAHGMLGL